MLEIRIEVVPFGIESKRKLLDKITIINTGRHEERPEKGEYIVHHSDGSFIISEHLRSDGYWPLVKRALEEIID